MPVQLACERCGDGFEVKPSRKDEAKYCSTDCANKTNGEARKGTAEKVTCECEWCGSEYEESPWREDRTRFCSASCKSSWVADDVGLGTDVSPEHERDPEKWQEFECEWCGDSYEEYKHRAGRTRFCSIECRREGVADDISGENCHWWSGDKEYDRGPNWHTQRRRARQRDEYECQECGLEEGDHYRQLSVHHIEPYDEFDGHEEANRLDNLVTMCQSCHQTVESITEVN